MKTNKYLSIDDIKPVGIYFLFDGERLLYIGKTTSFYVRINHHERDGIIPFNRVRFIPCWTVKLAHYERRWIKRFKPPYNGHFNGMRVQLPESETSKFMADFVVKSLG